MGTAAQIPKNMPNAKSIARNLAIPLVLNMVLMVRRVFNKGKRDWSSSKEYWKVEILEVCQFNVCICNVV